jgi:hypothetical protein
MKGHNEKCIEEKHRAKLRVRSKHVRNVPEKAAQAVEVQKPNVVPPTKAVRKARGAGIAEIRKEVCEASGIRGERPAERILSQLMQMQTWGPADADGVERALAAFEMLVELKPANVVEALLTVQMVGVHETALMFLKHATREEQTFAGRDANTFRATRLLRLFIEQLEAMARLKGKAGQQKVTVEHVHVYQGGQAIVGAVNAGKTEPA